MIDDIPEELKLLQQWVCFDITEDGRKIPYIPGMPNSKASANKPRTWRSFLAACKDVAEGKRQHVGFCFSSSDPYTFIDLDDPEEPDQIRVFERIDTYAQRSVSGEGCHLIAKGSFKGSGKHPADPEAGIFKENRFCLMTGDIAAGRSSIKVVPDEDLQAIHTWLGGSSNEIKCTRLKEFEAELPDMTVFEMGCDRFNKFRDLSNGKWEQHEEYNGDHSAADHAFIAMLCDLTESNEQVRYLFSMSGMWNEERAKKKAGHGLTNYVNRTVHKIRAAQEKERRLENSIQLTFLQNSDIGNEGEVEVAEKGFPTTRCDQITDAYDVRDFVSGLLVDEAMSVVYGPSNCGKSFWALHLGAAVSMGSSFFGRDTEQGAVLYFGLEGRSGAQNRVAAMKKAGLLVDQAPLHLCFSQLSLLEEEHTKMAIDTVRHIEARENTKLKLVIIDTYARGMAGGDENSGKDTSMVIKCVDAIRAACQAHILLIHHSGKDEARGARGHSSLRAATDTEIEITRPCTSSPSVVRVKKQRDLAIDKPSYFSLRPVYLGTDSKGRNITSCVLQYADADEAVETKRGRPQKAKASDLISLLPQESSGGWLRAAEEQLGIKKSTFNKLLKSIKESNQAQRDSKGAWREVNIIIGSELSINPSISIGEEALSVNSN